MGVAFFTLLVVENTLFRDAALFTLYVVVFTLSEICSIFYLVVEVFTLSSSSHKNVPNVWMFGRYYIYRVL